MNGAIRSLAWLSLLCLTGPLAAEECAAPRPFDRTSAIRGHLAFVPGTGATCDLVATLDSNSSRPSGALAWYSLSVPRPKWRISFRIDISQFGTGQVTAGTLILSATSRHRWPAETGRASMLSVALAGSKDPALPNLVVLVACGDAAACPDHRIVSYIGTVANGDVLRFELNSGAGDDGDFRWWINADYKDPPTGIYGHLDNGAWVGVQDVALGAFGPAGAIAANGTTLRFSDVESRYDSLFWSNFDE